MTSLPNIPLPFDAGAVVDSLRRRYGGLFDFRDFQFTVGTSQVQLLGLNADRISALFCNLGTADCFVRARQGPTTTNGIRLAAAGIISLSEFEDGVMTIQEWWAISGSPGQNVFVMEVFQYRDLDSQGNFRP